MENERLKKQIDFILEADKEKNILRQTHLSGNGRRENDAEHAWHMAMMVYLLKEYANEETETPEARFVRAMDNFQPLLLNNSNDGRDWKEHEIGKKQVMNRHSKTKLGSNVIWECTEKIIEKNVRNGNLKDDGNCMSNKTELIIGGN